MTYAENTTVPVGQSKTEIERTLSRYGASKFFTGWDADQAVIGFSMEDRFVQFHLPMPQRDSFTRTPGGQPRHRSAQIDKAWEQAQRSAWRALLLCVKAKLESVESRIETFEEAFLAHIMVADSNGGSTTVGAVMIPKMAESYEGKQPLLALPRSAS